MTTAVNSGLSTRLRGFRQVQRLAYECAEADAGRPEPGVTERHAARMQRAWLRERGVRDGFHLPFAWVGDRTAFANFRIPLQFFPTDRRLEPGTPFILDMAPMYQGFTADIGYSGSLGNSPNRACGRSNPHLGFRGTGGKFEEILVVTDSRDPEQSAFRLDDDLPHMRRWAEEK